MKQNKKLYKQKSFDDPLCTEESSEITQKPEPKKRGRKQIDPEIYKEESEAKIN